MVNPTTPNLEHVIVREFRFADEPIRGSHVHNFAAATLFDHLPRCGLSAQEHPFEVHVEDAIPMCFIQLGNGIFPAMPAIAHGTVYTSKFLNRPDDHLLNRCCNTDINGEGKCVSAF